MVIGVLGRDDQYVARCIAGQLVAYDGIGLTLRRECDGEKARTQLGLNALNEAWSKQRISSKNGGWVIVKERSNNIHVVWSGDPFVVVELKLCIFPCLIIPADIWKYFVNGKVIGGGRDFSVPVFLP